MLTRLSTAALLLIASTAAADISGTYTASSVRLTLTEQPPATVEGTLTVGDKSFPLSGTIADHIATGRVRGGDASFTFSAREVDGGIQLTCDSVTVRLSRVKSPSISAAAPESETAEAPATPRVDDAALAARLPSTYTHPLGFSIRHPESWKPRAINGTTALVPDDAPQLATGPGEVHAIIALEAPQDVESSLAQRVESEMARVLPGMRQTAEPQTLGKAVTLRYEAEGKNIAATLRATVSNHLLIILMSIGPADAISRHDSLAADVFQSITPAPRAIDQSIVGAWTHSSSYSSSGFSMASAKTYTLRANGTYTFSSRTAGGTADVSADSGDATDRGIWSAQDKTLTLVNAEGSVITRTYRVVDGNLLTFDASGKRTIWSR